MTGELATGSSVLDGFVVAVTGSSTGIGRAIALQMVAAGAKVIIHGRQLSVELANTQRQIESLSGLAVAVTWDFSETGRLDDCIELFWSQLGRVDCWVNNAGADILCEPNLSKGFAEKLEILWRTDVAATLILSRLAGSRMRDQISNPADRPCIINIGWSQAWTGMEGDSGELFATTKGAIMAATKSLAMSLAPTVRVNCIAPGWIQTDWGQSASESWDERACQQSLMNRWGTPADVAAAAVWLASPAANFISGQIINVDGGFRTW